MFRYLLSLLLVTAVPALGQNASWPDILTDPSARLHGPADLVLPMACGGGMAFQRVDVPVDVESPLADRPFRMGQSDANTAFSDYLKPTYLRGAFDDLNAGVSYYYIARYELNEAQYRAIKGDCGEAFKPVQARAKGRLSWFEAVELSRRYTEWLMANARDALPASGDRIGYLRLPTEPEWEYAARGGAKADGAVFAARRFFGEGNLPEYAAFRAPGSGSGGLTIMGGRRAPNPIGLLDVYGNAEELMLEPFRLNAIGRSHGQSGGLVTRGGSADLEDAQIYTAKRNEYPMFSAFTGEALAGEYFGMRLVLTAIVVSEDRYEKIRNNWAEEADRPADADADPLAALAALLEEEVDPRRRDALSGLQLEFRVAREAAAESLFQAAKSTLLSGAAFVETLEDGNREVQRLTRDSLALRDRLALLTGTQREQLMQTLILNVDRLTALRESVETYLLSYRATLETLASDVEAEMRESAYTGLAQDLAQADQTQLLTMLNRFWEDLLAYMEAPDMSKAELLERAIN